jgi:hypothetical protein
MPQMTAVKLERKLMIIIDWYGVEYSTECNCNYNHCMGCVTVHENENYVRQMELMLVWYRMFRTLLV